ncbi:hypothetical protein [Paramicrobacterium humi]|uniref:hypothetical protein n=1 Tax=Paramicrobacterium humi TaxID=640635 RepID=UPI00115F7B72|nr:hypothetical protein [Microbacterium humi]
MSAGRLIGIALVGAALGGILWVVGLALEFCIAVALIVVMLGVLWLCRPSAEELTWPDRELERPAGRRDDVSRLGWSLRPQRSGIGDAGIKRVRELARVRLERRSLDLDDAGDETEIARLLGPHARRVLRPGADPAPSLAHINAVLDRLSTLTKKENS